VFERTEVQRKRRTVETRIVHTSQFSESQRKRKKNPTRWITKREGAKLLMGIKRTERAYYKATEKEVPNKGEGTKKNSIAP